MENDLSGQNSETKVQCYQEMFNGPASYRSHKKGCNLIQQQIDVLSVSQNLAHERPTISKSDLQNETRMAVQEDKEDSQKQEIAQKARVGIN